MRKLVVFNQISVDGYFTDEKGDMSWAHKQDPEWNAFVEENAQGGGQLLFGRITYAMMASYWPTPQAAKANPVVAERMNQMPKVVFSRTLAKAAWNNTRIVKGNIAEEVLRMKQESGPDMAIFGSGTIIPPLTEAKLIDEYQMVVNPIVLGKGRTMFEGVAGKLGLQFQNSRPFKNGNVVVTYKPAG